jgi:hypothetical protein
MEQLILREEKFSLGFKRHDFDPLLIPKSFNDLFKEKVSLSELLHALDFQIDDVRKKTCENKKQDYLNKKM